MNLNVLIIDDNAEDRELAGHHLARVYPDIRMMHISNEQDLVAALKRDDLNGIITDLRLGWSDGVSVLKRVKERSPHCAVIMFTGSGNEEVAVEAMKAGLDDYVTKHPKNYARLPTVLRLALQRIQAQRELEETQHRLRETVTLLEQTRSDLFEKVIELERFMDVASDRELRMVDLKQKNQRLESEVQELRHEIQRLKDRD